MQATGLLPGLYEVLGTHFGKAGYRVGGVAALAAAVLIILSPAALIAAVVYGGIQVTSGSVSSDTALRYVYYVVGVLLVLPMSWLLTRPIVWWDNRNHDKQRDRIREYLDEHVLEGAYVVIHVSGDEAAEQWPEIKRRIEEMQQDSP